MKPEQKINLICRVTGNTYPHVKRRDGYKETHTKVLIDWTERPLQSLLKPFDKIELFKSQGKGFKEMDFGEIMHETSKDLKEQLKELKKGCDIVTSSKSGSGDVCPKNLAGNTNTQVWLRS